MNKHKIWNLICGIVWAIMLAAEAFAAVFIIRLDMLPNRYLALVLAILAAIWLIVGMLMFRRSKRGQYQANYKDSPSIARRVIAMILALAMSVCSFAVVSVVNEVYDTVSGITGDLNVETVTMAVYVRNDDAAQTLADAAEYTFGVVSGYEESRTNAMVSAICQELSAGISINYYNSVNEMIDALYAGTEQAVILNSAYVELMQDNDLYTDFFQVARELYTEAITEVVENKPSGGEVEDDNAGEVVQEDRDITEDPFIVYISGSDTETRYLSTSRSDVNILVVVNPSTKQVLLLNTPRDYYIGNPAGNYAKDKLTHCGIYGISCSMAALEKLYGIDIDYYAQINFKGFETLIDAIGGIEVYSDWGFYAGSEQQYWIKSGYNYLYGKQALAFARERHNLPTGDNGRGINQMKVITAVINKVTSGTTIISKYSAILDSIQGMFKTNIATEEISSLVKMQLDDMAQWNIQSYAVTGTDGSATTYSVPGSYAYVMYPDQSTVDHASDLVNRVMVGEILTGTE